MAGKRTENRMVTNAIEIAFAIIEQELTSSIKEHAPSEVNRLIEKELLNDAQARWDFTMKEFRQTQDEDKT